MNSNTYRANAVACAELAEAVNDPYARLVLLNMAEGWLRLADYVEFRQQTAVAADARSDDSSDKDLDIK